MSKVTICHATASATNPYVRETVDTASIAQALKGHGHSGVNVGDIIPAFTYRGEAFSAQGNQSILANGCSVVTSTTVPQTPTTTSGDPGVASTTTTPPSTGAPAGGSSPALLSVPGATSVHTGMPFAGALPAEAGALGLGLLLLGAGVVRRVTWRR